MQCPIDKTDLVMTDRQGVEIDYCPQCRGVWLDRGELDKIIERGTSLAPASPQPQQPPQPMQQQQYQAPDYPQQQRYDKHGNQSGYNQGYPRKKRKESFLGDLFDF